MLQSQYLVPLLDVAVRSSFTPLDSQHNLTLDLTAVEPRQTMPQTGQVINHNTYSTSPPTQGVTKGEADHVVVYRQQLFARHSNIVPAR